MRVLFIPSGDKHWIQYYAQQQAGKGFEGLPFQRGGGLGNLFRGLYRFLLPVVKSAGKTVGKQALKTGALVASDLVAGGDFKKVIKKRGKKAASTLLRTAARKLNQKGGRKSIKGPAKKKKIIRKKKKQPKKKRRKTYKKQDQFGVYYK
jgi:hypothetical protein